MTNYCGVYRSNYFRVKNPEAFNAYCARFGFEHLHGDTEGDKVGFMCGDSDDGGGLPSFGTNAETDELEEADPIKELGALLEAGEVAIVMETGAEILRYLVGMAWAVNSEGKVRHVSLDDIYSKAKRLGPNVTSCQF